MNVIVKKGKEGGSIEYLPRSGKSEPPATDYPPITRADCVLNSIVVVKKPQAEPNGARRSPRSPGRTLGYIDLEQRTLQTIDNPFGTRLSPMSWVRSVTHVSGPYRRCLAEREGFEPSRRFPAYTLSRRAPSTTRPPLRIQAPDFSDGSKQSARHASHGRPGLRQAGGRLRPPGHRSVKNSRKRLSIRRHLYK